MDKRDIDGENRQFDPSYEVSVAWQRLADGKHIKNCDLVLIKHEVLEMELIKEYNISQAEAHVIASKKYDFGSAFWEDSK